MKEQFVSYSIALKLKELGFDEECFAIYIMNKDEKYELDFYSSKFLKPYGDINYLLSKKFNPHHNNVDYPKDYFDQNYMILAPLWQQVIDWLFNRYGFIVYYSNDDWSLVTKNESFLYNELPNSTIFQKWEKAILKVIELITLKQ